MRSSSIRIKQYFGLNFAFAGGALPAFASGFFLCAHAIYL